MSLISELQRRNVIRVAMAYVALAWLVLQVLDTLAPLFGLRDETARFIVILLVIGLVPVLVVSWLFELTPEGFKREGGVDHSTSDSRDSARRLDRIIIGMLALAVVYFAFDKFVLDPTRDTEIAQTAAELARDEMLLEQFGEHSIAVLPFVDLSPNKDQEYFSDGIAEEIINLLSRIRKLRVIARSSAFSFKGQNLAASEIGRRLNVNYIMEGSVRRAGDRLRITTTMIDARTDTQLWSEKFDRNFGDIFAIQDEIAGEVVDRLEMQISGMMPLSDRVDPESYALFLQARHLLDRHSGEAATEADRLLGEALDIDPENIAAWLLYDRVNSLQQYWGQMTQEDAVAHVRDAMNRVLELDPANPQAEVSLAQLDQKALDTWEGELQAVSFGLKLLPTGVNTNLSAAGRLSRLGFEERALEYFEYVLGKDPLCVGCLRGQMLTLMAQGDYEQALDVNRRYRTITGGSGTFTLGIIQLLQDDPETALETMNTSDTIPFVMVQGKALAYWSMGRTDEYEAALAEFLKFLGDERFENLVVRPEDYLAKLYAWVGRNDDAIEILETLIDPPRSWGPIRWNTDPLFKSLHDDPRWFALLEKEGIAPQQIESYELDKLFPGPGIIP